jgi:hypothetical protein
MRGQASNLSALWKSWNGKNWRFTGFVLKVAVVRLARWLLECQEPLCRDEIGIQRA